MRYRVIYSILLSSAFLFFACQEDFNPIGEFRQGYVLNCILRGDSTLQTATVTMTYPPANNGAAVPPAVVAVKDAIIRVWVNDSVRFFYDTTAIINNKQTDFYVLKNFKPLPNDFIEIEALLPNGKRLKSAFTMPPVIEFLTLPAPYSVPFEGKNTFELYWKCSERELLFASHIYLSYATKNGEDFYYHYVEIPSEFIENDGQLIPYYPIPSKTPMLSIKKDALARAMSKISEGNPVKYDYYIEALYLETSVCDKNLATYFSSTVNQSNSLTVRLDEFDFSNIQGGFGIFGGFYKKRWKYPINKTFIEDMGYRAL